MHETPLSAELIEAIAAKVAMGILPQTPPRQTWGGNGSGRTCMACDATIGLGQMELDSELASGGRMSLHADCFTAWWRAVDVRPGADMRTDGPPF